LSGYWFELARIFAPRKFDGAARLWGVMHTKPTILAGNVVLVMPEYE